MPLIFCTVSKDLSEQQLELFTKEPKQQKTMTVLIYMASDNDLNYFAKKNLIDMQKIGSTDHVNILVQVDGLGPYGKNKRYFVEKGNLVQVNKHDTSEMKLDFGNAQTLIDACMWTIENYPSDYYTLILWNHGIGILDSIGGKTSNASELFTYNSDTNMLEINRTISFIEYAKHKEEEKEERGICFSDTFGTYLTNQKLIHALSTVQKNLHGFKFDIVAFDACLMAMLEVADLLQPYAHIMVASQELELGAGYPYHKIFEPYLTEQLNPQQFAQHIVKVYGNHYKLITSDYTQSAVNLDTLQTLKDPLEKTTLLLLEALRYQKNNSVTRLIQASKNKRLCTCFSEPTYIDLYDFLHNLSESVDHMLLQQHMAYIKNDLLQSLHDTMNALQSVVFANEVGSNLHKAQGLSIYFPHKTIDGSYHITPFAGNYSWIQLLRTMLGL